jgi:hypothetical protein
MRMLCVGIASVLAACGTTEDIDFALELMACPCATDGIVLDPGATVGLFAVDLQDALIDKGCVDVPGGPDVDVTATSAALSSIRLDGLDEGRAVTFILHIYRPILPSHDLCVMATPPPGEGGLILAGQSEVVQIERGMPPIRVALQCSADACTAQTAR